MLGWKEAVFVLNCCFLLQYFSWEQARPAVLNREDLCFSCMVNEKQNLHGIPGGAGEELQRWSEEGNPGFPTYYENGANSRERQGRGGKCAVQAPRCWGGPGAQHCPGAQEWP